MPQASATHRPHPSRDEALHSKECIPSGSETMSNTKPRYAYADESGDAGYNFGANSSRCFVMGIVLPKQPEELVDRLLSLRRALRRPETFEFHFRQANPKTRQSFLEVIRDEPLDVIIAVIHKQYAPADFRRLGKLGVYSHALAGLSLRAPFAMSQCRVHLDGSGKQKQFLQSLKSNVRWACRVAGRVEQSPADIRLLDSGHSLIQCADMVTGSAAEYVNNGDERWLNMLRPKLAVYWDERFDGQG